MKAFPIRPAVNFDRNTFDTETAGGDRNVSYMYIGGHNMEQIVLPPMTAPLLADESNDMVQCVTLLCPTQRGSVFFAH